MARPGCRTPWHCRQCKLLGRGVYGAGGGEHAGRVGRRVSFRVSAAVGRRNDCGASGEHQLRLRPSRSDDPGNAGCWIEPHVHGRRWGNDLRHLSHDNGKLQQLRDGRSSNVAVLGGAGSEREHTYRLFVSGRCQLGAGGESDDHDGAECLHRTSGRQRKLFGGVQRQLR
jgi:hypothetical protein